MTNILTSFLMSRRRFSLVALVLILLIPAGSHAAAVKPSCTLAINTNRGTVETPDSLGVLVLKDHTLTIEWSSVDATRAKGPTGAVSLSGTTEIQPTKKTTYTYVFSNGNRKAKCSVTAYVADPTIDYSSLTSTKSKPILTGTAKGLKSVHLEFRKGTFADPFYVSREIKVKNGKWEFKMPEALADGTYKVNLYGPKNLELNYVVTGMLTVTSAGAPSVRVVQDQAVAGGPIKAGAEFPVAYLRVTNTSSGLATIDGFWLDQKGDAPEMAIVGFGINDDQGGGAGGSGGVEGYSPFREGYASVPTSGTLAPGETRVYTIIGALSKNASAYAGKQVRIDVHSMQAAAPTGNSFPIVGAVYTIKL